jgi:hypothetical protein
VIINKQDKIFCIKIIFGQNTMPFSFYVEVRCRLQCGNQEPMMQKIGVASLNITKSMILWGINV